MTKGRFLYGAEQYQADLAAQYAAGLRDGRAELIRAQAEQAQGAPSDEEIEAAFVRSSGVQIIGNRTIYAIWCNAVAWAAARLRPQPPEPPIDEEMHGAYLAWVRGSVDENLATAPHWRAWQEAWNAAKENSGVGANKP